MRKNRISFPIGWAGREAFFKYTDLSPNTKPFVPVLLFIDKDFSVNRQYSQNHPFFNTGALANTRGVVNMLVLTPRGQAKDLPRTQSSAPKTPAKK